MEDISHSFLSSAEAELLRGIAALLGPSLLKPEHPLLPLSQPKSPLLLPVFCCLSVEIASYFSCNLSLEMARCNQTVSVIDFCPERPNVRYLMGNLVDLQNDFPAKNTDYLDFKIESIKLYGFSRITIVSLAVSGEKITAKQIIKRIFAEQNIEKSNIILINSPNGPDGLPASEPFTHFQRALFLMDSRMCSLLKTYSWIKKSLPTCQRYLAGAVSQPGEETGLPQQNAAKLEKVISKYLPVTHGTLMADIPMDQDALDSIRLRKPLVLTGASSASSRAVSNLCENLLSSE